MSSGELLPQYCDWRVEFNPNCAFNYELSVLYILTLSINGFGVVIGLLYSLYRKFVMRMPFFSQEKRLLFRPVEFLFWSGFIISILRFSQAAVVFFQADLSRAGLEVFYEMFFVSANVSVIYYLYAIIIILPEDGSSGNSLHYNYSVFREIVTWVLGVMPFTNLIWAALTGYYYDVDPNKSEAFFKVHYFFWGFYNICEWLFYIVLGGRVLSHLYNSFKLTHDSINSSYSAEDVEKRATHRRRVLDYLRMQFHVHLFANTFLLMCITQVCFGALRVQILESKAWTIIFNLIMNSGISAFYIGWSIFYAISDQINAHHTRLVQERRKSMAALGSDRSGPNNLN